MNSLINIEGLVDEGVLKNIALNKSKIHTQEGFVSLSGYNFLKDIYQITLKTAVTNRKSIHFKDDIISVLKVCTNLEILAIDTENNVSYIKKDLIFSTTFSINLEYISEINIYIIDAYFEVTDKFNIQYSLIYCFNFTEKYLNAPDEIISFNETLDLIDIKREFP